MSLNFAKSKFVILRKFIITMNKKYLQKIIDYTLLSLLMVFPLTINISLISPKDAGHPIIALNLSIADILIGITFLEAVIFLVNLANKLLLILI